MKHIPSFDSYLEESKKKGLWANIHAKRERGEKPAKPGDEDYPDEEAWKAAKKSSESQDLDEGYMSELDIIRQQSKSVDDFIKKAKLEFPQIAKMKDADNFLKELWEIGLNEASNAETDKNIANLSDQALLIMCDTFNDYHKNAKGKMTDNDMAFIMKLFIEKTKRGLK
jgi:hypothetical protein